MNIQKCPNCGAALSCTCQQRRSLGGKMGCSSCIGSLNAAERKNGVTPAPAPKAPAPKVNSVHLLKNKKT